MLVTDVGLPGGMNGRQIAEAARSLSPTIVVLFVTGYAQGAAFDHGELPQNMEVLTKPFDLSTFGRRVQTMLGAAAAAQASA